jgi:hypothetical protein
MINFSNVNKSLAFLKPYLSSALTAFDGLFPIPQVLSD